MTNKPSSHAKKPGHTLVAVAVLLICALVILPSGCLDNNKDSGADTKAPTAPSNNDKTKVPGPGSTDPGSRPVTTPQDPAKPVVTEPSTVIARPGGSGGGSSGSSGSSSVIELTGITITQSSPQTVYNGGTLQLSSTLTPNDATYTGRTWYSNNTSVATVDSSGLVTGVADGTAKIYVNSTKNPLINTSIEVTVASKVSVDSVASLNKAISASNVTNITLSGSVNGNVDATRTSATNLSIDFLAYALTGDMQIKADSLLGLNLTGTANPAVTGKLTVSAMSATVKNRLSVNGSTNIQAVANHSWIEQAEGNSLSMGDNNGASLILEKSPREVKVTPAARNINITTTVPVEIIIDEGASVSNITASSEAASGTNITNNGMVANISTAANTNITVVNNNNNSNITVDGSGTIGFSGSASGAHNALGTVKVVSDISSNLGLNKTPIYAGDTFNITGVSLNSNESFYVKSAGATIVNVSNSSELNLTAMATGRTSVTVQVKDAGNVTKQGTIFVTVVPQEISIASVTMTAPVVGASPASASASDSNYTVTETRWSPGFTPGGKFKAATNYTATVTLTSINGKAFSSTPFIPTVANSSSVSATTTTGSSSGNRVSFDVTFPKTDALSVTNIDITTQPSKLSYKTVVENVLSLKGMVVKATYNDGETETSTFTGTAVTGYSTNLSDGQILNETHNGIHVNVTHEASGRYALTDALTVSIAGSDANLSTFKVNGTDVLALSNVTNLNETGYTFNVNELTGFKNITAIANDSNAKVTIKVNNVNVAISSANTTALHNNDVITVTVVSEDRASTKHYKVTVKESDYLIHPFNIIGSPQQDNILFSIARTNPGSEAIPGLAISDFTLIKDMGQAGAQTISNLGLYPGHGTQEYIINISGATFAPGNYTLTFAKAKHESKEINFIIEGITGASVALTQGSVDFGYVFKNATNQSIGYTAAKGEGYWLDDNNSTVHLLYYANSSSPVKISSLGLDATGHVKYTTLSEVQTAFNDTTFFSNMRDAPTGIVLSLIGKTSDDADAKSWYLNTSTTFSEVERDTFRSIVPGSSGALPIFPTFVQQADKIGGLYVSKNEMQSYAGGNRSYVEFSFEVPSTYNASSYALQNSSDNSNWNNISGFENLTYNNACIYPIGASYYRLLVNDGPKAGNTSNVVHVVPSEVESKYNGWSMDQSIGLTGIVCPYVGHGMDASFNVTRIGDSNNLNNTLSLQWYRVNPVDYSMTPIPGANASLYVTTEADAGYKILCRASGDNSSTGGFIQIFGPLPTPIIPNEAVVSDITNGGFKLSLNKSVPGGLKVSDLNLTNNSGSPITISNVTSNNNATFIVTTASLPVGEVLILKTNSTFWDLVINEGGHMMRELGFSYGVLNPTVWPTGGLFIGDTYVTLTTSTPGATIYYTTDGSVPTASSAAYSSSILISSNTTIKAIATKSGMVNSSVMSYTYNITPVIGTGYVNITAPVRGATPQTFSDVENATSSANYTVSSLTWYNASGGAVGANFEAGEVYTANMSLTSKNGKAFLASFTPNVTNGTNSTVWVNGTGAGNVAWFNVTFNPTVALSSNANLSALNVDTGTLVPVFANTTLEYNVTVGKEVASINVAATHEHANAALTINGTGATSGNPSNVTLKDANELTIVPVEVTAEDGSTTKTYNITVSRVVPSMSGTVTIEGDAVYGKTLTANTTDITYNLICTRNVPTYQWSNGSIIANATNATFVIRAEDIGTNISVNVTADGVNATGSVTSANSSTVTKATPAAAPGAPSLSSKTNNSVTLDTIANAQYSYNGTWQNATLFTGLTPNTEYRFIARFEENATHFNSTNSSVLTVTTNNTTVNILTIEGVVAPVVGETPVTSITGTAQYTGTVSWTPNHTKFQGNTTYNASIVLRPETNFTLDGLASDSFNVTNAILNTTYISNSTVVSRFATTGVAEGAAITGLDVPINVLQIGKTITRTAATDEGGAGDWRSSNETVATIDGSSGVVTANAVGTATISYNYSASGNSSSTSITVYARATNKSDNLVIAEVAVGGVEVTVSGNSTATAYQTIKWVSSNASAATIGETSGTITAVASGTTTISYNITVDATGAIVEEGSRVITVLAAAPGGLALSKGVEGNTTNVTKLSAGDYEYWVNDSAKFSATADDYGNISNIAVEVGSIINIRATTPLSANASLTVQMADIMNGTAPVGLDLAQPSTGTGTNVTGLVADTMYQYTVAVNSSESPEASAEWTAITGTGSPYNFNISVVADQYKYIFIRVNETAKLPASIHTKLEVNGTVYKASE